MSVTKRIILIIPHMIGGGAERVASLLMNEFHRSGYETSVVLTADTAEDVVRRDLDEGSELVLLKETMPPEPALRKLLYGVILRVFAQIACNLFELFGLPVPAVFAKASLLVQYRREISWLKNELAASPETAVIAFLQPAVPIALLAARGLTNKVIFSERGNPRRLMKKRYGRKFIEKYYPRADAAVFQTQDAKSVYPESVAKKGVVIPNPLKSGLPEPYDGERTKRIVSFCRISPEKNLAMLVRAFARLLEQRPGHTLAIYGDAANAEGERCKAELISLIDSLGISGSVSLLPSTPDVHSLIVRDAMYVNSSDSEGLSNAMLEAMAIGLPCICTDCPVGGARATVISGENGILIPTGDEDALFKAMLTLADDAGLCKKLSRRAAEIRKSLSLDAIAARWMELL